MRGELRRPSKTKRFNQPLSGEEPQRTRRTLRGQRITVLPAMHNKYTMHGGNRAELQGQYATSPTAVHCAVKYPG